MISVNNLKTDSENDYEKVMPSIPSPEHAVSCFDDLYFFKDFENEFPAIVYNDAQTSKSDLLTEPILNPQHIDEFDLSDETSLSEYDEEEQNVLYFNDLFPFNIIRPDDLKSEKDKDDNDIDITQSLLDNEITYGSTMLLETNMALPPHKQRHRFLRVQVVDFQVSVRWSKEAPELETVYSGLGITHSGGDGVPFLGLGTMLECKFVRSLMILGPGWPWDQRGSPLLLLVPLQSLRMPPIIDEGGQADPAPEQAPQQPPPPYPAAAKTIPQRLGRLEEDVQGLRRDVGSLRGLVDRSMTDQGRFSTWMMTCMTQLMDASGLTYQPFDGTFRGSSPLAFQRRTM
ncbi:hypothetical protein Tco_1344224 [Tanacetum coccineum]